MAFYRKSGGSNVTPTIVRRRSGSSWANVQTIKRRSGGSWVTVWTAYTPVSASVNKTSCQFTGTGTVPSKAVVLTPSAGPTASGANGNGSYTFAWEFVSGDSRVSATTPTSANTGFNSSGQMIPNNATWTAVYRCKVSDGTSSAYTANVTVSLSYTRLI